MLIWMVREMGFIWILFLKKSKELKPLTRSREGAICSAWGLPWGRQSTAVVRGLGIDRWRRALARGNPNRKNRTFYQSWVIERIQTQIRLITRLIEDTAKCASTSLHLGVRILNLDHYAFMSMLYVSICWACSGRSWSDLSIWQTNPIYL